MHNHSVNRGDERVNVTTGALVSGHMHNMLSKLGRTKHYMPAIEPRGALRAQEELRTVCVGTCIGHGEDTRAQMTQLKVLIFKLGPVNTTSA